MIDHNKFQSLVQQLYATVQELEAMFPGRHFTPDGHMVGSVGECLVADANGLKLLPDGTFEEIYNGPGALVWSHFKGKVLPSNGQFLISLHNLRKLNKLVSPVDRVSNSF